MATKKSTKVQHEKKPIQEWTNVTGKIASIIARLKAGQYTREVAHGFTEPLELDPAFKELGEIINLKES